jgi:hypothetical protein
MQKFLIVNTKGFSLEQAILAMHTNLQQLHEKPETSMLEIHSVNFVNTFEKPQKSSLDLNGTNQPVIVYNCCVVLVEPKQNDQQPSLDEIKELKQAARVFCQHNNLDTAKHTKAHKNVGAYFQICKDCGAEVWEDIPTDMKEKKMFIVPPVSDQLNERISIEEQRKQGWKDDGQDMS